ncbi:ankyrin repeat domain-containing protein [Parashewanella tropica]|uniref:ankyrin repeat domain-containing protein n=1 Tax=Parashewanella tropica TaxID=2547970 RepID=UPI001478A10F|nr:ankyrin repeat domain-containing protein [Parashewanella tropica]
MAETTPITSKHLNKGNIFTDFIHKNYEPYHNDKSEGMWTTLELCEPKNITKVEPFLLTQTLCPKSLESAMLRSISDDNPEAVSKLLAAGVTIDRQKHYQFPWLHVCALNCSPKVMSLLLHHKGNVNAVDQDGKTPLHIAAQYDRHLLLPIFVENSQCDINAIDNSGNTPLLCASLFNSWTFAMKLSMEPRININHENHTNLDVLTLAIKSNQHKLIKQLLMSPKIKLKVRHLKAAVHANNQIALQHLLPNARELLSPFLNAELLNIAASRGFRPIIQTLLAQGVNVNCADINGNTAIHTACLHSHSELVSDLLATPNLNLSIRNEDDQNPLAIANQAYDKQLKSSTNHTHHLESARQIVVKLTKHIKSEY